MKESLTAASYQENSLESFCDSLIREQDKLIHLGIINNADTSGKSLLLLIVLTERKVQASQETKFS